MYNLPDLDKPIDYLPRDFKLAAPPYFQFRAYLGAPGTVMCEVTDQTHTLGRGVGRTLGEALVQMGLHMTGKNAVLITLTERSPDV